MSHAEERRQERFEYAEDVDLAAIDESKKITGHAVNLSPNGLLVRVPEPWQVGSELFCQLPLGEKKRTLVGRVVWVDNEAGSEDSEDKAPADADPPVQTTPDVGMGVEFVAYSDADAPWLASGSPADATDATRPRTKRVHVQFPESDHAIQADALAEDGSLYLHTSLPFLTKNAPVRLVDQGPKGDQADPTEPVRASEAFVQNVSLAVIGDNAVPWLRIKVGEAPLAKPASTEPAATEPAATELAATEPAPPELAPPELAPPTEHETSSDEVADHAPQWEDVSLTTEEASLPDLTAWDVDELKAADEFEEEDQASGLWEQLRHLGWGVGYWAAAVALLGFFGFLIVQHLRSDKAPADTAPVAAVTTVTKEEKDPAQGRVPAKEAAPKKPKIQPVVASARVAPPVVNKPAPVVERPVVPAQVAASTPVAPTPAAPRDQRAAPARKPAPRAPPSREGTSRSVSPTGGPKIVRRGNQLTVVVPLEQSDTPLELGRTYALSAPVGVAVNVPEAVSRIPYALYRYEDPAIDKVWLRQLESGLQIRVFVNGAVPSHEIKMGRSQLSITFDAQP